MLKRLLLIAGCLAPYLLHAQITTNNPDNGDVGIGVAPQAKLHIATGTVTTGNQTFRALRLSPAAGAAHAGNGSAIHFDAWTNQGAGSVAGIWSALWSGGSGSNNFSGAMVFGTKNDPDQQITERMRITQEGNIGIATTDTKGYKLAVNGSMIATSIKVKSFGSWPDYVFKPNYQLLPLDQVASYVKVHQHLPEIPSEQEIKSKGLDLGEMNKILLAKVEELTLYLIEQNKKINEQDKRLDMQQAEIMKLKTRKTYLKK